MGKPDCHERLRSLIASMDEARLLDLYERMVRSRDYVPVDVIGRSLWFELREHENEDRVLRRIGAACRGRLGIGGP